MDGAFGNQDYGMDGGRGGRGGGRSGFRGNADNAKTKLCNRWASSPDGSPSPKNSLTSHDLAGGCKANVALEIGATLHTVKPS